MQSAPISRRWTRDAAESLAQFTSARRQTALDLSADADVRDLDGLAVCWADVPVGFANALTLTEVDLSAAALADRLGAAAELMHGKRHPGALWLFEGLLGADASSRLDATAAAAGLVRASNAVGMAGDILPVEEGDGAGLVIRRRETDEDTAAYATVLARAYGAPPPPPEEAVRGSTPWRQAVVSCLGIREGTPVCCASAVAIDGRLYLLAVGTDIDFQRRGYGEKIVRATLNAASAPAGLRRVTLHATDAGLRTFERLGLTRNSPIGVYRLAG